MTFPTILSPWFVVQRGAILDEYDVEFYTNDGSGLESWSKNPKQAMLFMSLAGASRVADAEGAIVRVIYSKETAREFRPRELSEEG